MFAKNNNSVKEVILKTLKCMTMYHYSICDMHLGIMKAGLVSWKFKLLS